MGQDAQSRNGISVYSGQSMRSGTDHRKGGLLQTGESTDCSLSAQPLSGGWKDAAHQAVTALWRKRTLAIINDQMIPALDRSGKGI